MRFKDDTENYIIGSCNKAVCRHCNRNIYHPSNKKRARMESEIPKNYKCRCRRGS